MIKVENLFKAYGDHRIIDNLSFEIGKGDFVAITGESGKGKSTLLNCMGLLEPFEGGKIFLEGNDISKLSKTNKRLILRNKLGYLFQNYALIDNETVESNLEIALTYSSLSKQQKKLAMNEALNELGLKDKLKSKVYTLSGGEQQRVAIARLLLKKPSIIFADEPTGALDMNNSNAVMEILKKINALGTTICIVTHDEMIAQQCTYRICL